MRLVGADGSQIGIVEVQDALRQARDLDLDLVEVAPQASPPVCRIMDYGKYKYEQEQKAKTARKHQVSINVKEIKLRPKIGVHDYETKKGHVVRFLKQRAKVKVTIMFRGREQSHPERGRDLLMRLAEDVKEIGQIESPPLQDGRNMVMVLGPNKSVGQPAQTQDQPTVAEPEAAAEQAPAQEPETEAQAEVGAAQGAQAKNQ